VIPVATRAYRVRVAVATVQFSRAAERALMPAVEHAGCDGGRRSLKTQQHARAQARRYASLARPGSVDVLGRAVGDRPIPSLGPKAASSRTAPCRTGTSVGAP
jgi:hypothetical protein